MTDVTTLPGQRTRLEGHGQLLIGPAGPGGLMLIGAVTTVIGVYAAATGSGAIRAADTSFNVPRWLLVDIGALFLFVGLPLLAHGLVQMGRAVFRRRRRQQHFSQPWLWDHHWDSAGTSLPVVWPTISDVLVMMVLTALVAPFHLLPHEVPMWVVWIFDAVVVSGWLSTIYRAGQRMKYGRCRLRFDSFPFYLGSSMSGAVEFGNTLAGVERVTCTIRCVQERIEKTKTRSHKGTVQSFDVVCEALYEARQVFTSAELGLQPDSLHVNFALPSGEFDSRISDVPPRYWELEVKAPMPGIDYSATFYLPVYSPTG